MDSNHPPSLWSGQLLHFLTLTALLGLTWLLWVKIGKPFPIPFWSAIGIPIAHQIFVWLSWRLEFRSNHVSNSLGLNTYLAIFLLLLAARPIVFLFLAWMDYGSLGLSIFPRIILSLLFLVPAIYTMHSVKKHFGFTRAAGADHFEEKYRNMALVKKGMFKYSKNSMYVFGFLMFWGIAFSFDSKATLLASAFSHAYIWVHYFATEKPDMDYLYGN